MQFAGCTFDVGARRFFRGRRERHLSPKAFELLTVLIDSRPRAVSKTELLDRVWPGVFVSDASLARVVNEIRDAVGGHRDRVVRTVHRYGYAFSADVDPGAVPHGEDAARRPAVCRLTSATREIELHDGEHIAGRDTRADIRLDSPKVSRRHAHFVVNGTQVSVQDLGSKNGTFVGGTRLTGRVMLQDRDQVRLGPFTFVFSVETMPWSTETEVEATRRSQR
jgi:DNA-binding winged helix-turn-helix (wHTH) protein